MVTTTDNEKEADQADAAALIAYNKGDIALSNTWKKKAKELRDTPNTQTVTTPGYVNETETGTGTENINTGQYNSN